MICVEKEPQPLTAFEIFKGTPMHIYHICTVYIDLQKAADNLKQIISLSFAFSYKLLDDNIR